jgi:hypothetical protein
MSDDPRWSDDPRDARDEDRRAGSFPRPIRRHWRRQSAANGRRVLHLPMGLDPSGRAVLLYLVTAPWTDEFRTFLQDQTAWLRVA